MGEDYPPVGGVRSLLSRRGCFPSNSEYTANNAQDEADSEASHCAAEDAEHREDYDQYTPS